MAERKPGPVKPPTIDLTAREVSPDAEPAAPAGTQGRGRSRPRQPQDAAVPGTDTSRPAGGTEGGAADDAIGTPAQTADGSAEHAADAASSVSAKAAEVPDGGTRAADTTPPEAGEPEAAPLPEAVVVLPWGAILAAIVAGAFLGTALTYLVATFAPLPTSAPIIADPSADLAAHEQRLSALEAANAALADQAERLRSGSEAMAGQLESGLAELRQSVADAQGAAVPAETVAALRSQVASLSDRIAAIAAGASSSDAEALAQTIASLQQAVAGLDSRLDALEGSRSATETALAGLRADVEALQKALAERQAAAEEAAPNAARTAAADALARAIEEGAPFGAELRAALAAAPRVPVPPALEARAASGLPTAEMIARRFSLRVPDMLAASAPAAGEGWQDAALGWVASMLALRPASEVEGDSPEAVVSRLEGAMARHDFRTARALFDQLPAPMRTAAGDVVELLSLRLAADDLVAALRSPDAESAQ